MIRNSLTIFSFFLAINLLLLFCCCSQASSLNNTDDTTTIQGDDVSGSRSARQYLLPALLMNYQQAPLNTFDRWYNSIQTIAKLPDVEYDGRSWLNKKFETGCGAGPDGLPQRHVARIVGGSAAVKNSWPFMVALRLKTFFLCGGSLIRANKILTAAHCVERLSLFEISALSVSLGMHAVGDPRPTDTDAQMTRRVTRVTIHNDYNTATQLNNIAILTLDAPVPFSAAISPVCLARPSNDPDQFANTQAAVMGWGALKDGGKIPVSVLQQTSLDIITNADCKAIFPKVSTKMICSSSTNKDVCQGDRGDPIVIRSAAGLWTQVGIVIDGACANPVSLAVYTRVSAFRNWIDYYA